MNKIRSTLSLKTGRIFIDCKYGNFVNPIWPIVLSKNNDAFWCNKIHYMHFMDS